MSTVSVERLTGRRLEVRTQEAATIVDRPVDAGGQGGGFRSTELLLGALGSCTVGTLLGFAEEQGIDVGAVRAELKAVTSLATDRVLRVRLTLHVGGPVSATDLDRLTAAAADCKVHRSLHAGITTELTLVPGDAGTVDAGTAR